VAAVIVLPLLAADALPMPAGVVPAYVPDALPPLPAAAPAVPRTPKSAPTPTTNAIPREAPDQIRDEVLRPPVSDFTVGVVPPTGSGPVVGDIGGTEVGVPQPPSPPPPVVQKPVRLSAYEMPRKVHEVAPLYPTIAQKAGIEGVVIIEAVIAVDGSVRDARVLKSVALLDRAAIDAVKKWRYAPTRLNGVAVPVIVTVTVQFRLQR
jgi:protein TonB